jgi:hypothetical protein
MTGKTQVVSALAQVGTLQTRGQQRHEMIPSEQLRQSRVSEDERRHFISQRRSQHYLQHHCRMGDWRALTNIKPHSDLTRRQGRQGSPQSPDRHRPFYNASPGHVGFARWSG